MGEDKPTAKHPKKKKTAKAPSQEEEEHITLDRL